MTDVPASVSGKANPYRLLVVDDHPIVREGLMQLLNLQSDLQICCGAGSAAEAIAATEVCRHDLAIVDLSLRGESGLDLIHALRTRDPLVRILVLSMYDETLVAVRALQSGADGYLMKQEGSQHILQAVREILAGKRYLSASLQAHISQHLFATGKQRGAPLPTLSEKEVQVLQLMGMGMGTREIADHLNRSIKTIEAHRANLKDKLGLKSGQDLMRYAIRALDAG